jgi:hypothetical protein
VAVDLPPLLRRLGFHKIHIAESWQSFTFHDLEILVVPSAKGRPEAAFSCRHEGSVLFNAVDIAVSDTTVEAFHQRWGAPSLLIPRLPPFNQKFIKCPEFANRLTTQHFNQVDEFLSFRAHAIATSGFDIANAYIPWINHRNFPVSEAEELAAYRAKADGKTVLTARPGASWELTNGFINRETLLTDCYVSQEIISTEFDPAVSPREFRDYNDFNATPELANDFVLSFDLLLLRDCHHRNLQPLIEENRSLGLNWRYQINLLGDVVFDKTLAVSAGGIAWREPQESDLLIQLAGSALSLHSRGIVGGNVIMMSDQLRVSPAAYKFFHLNYLARTLIPKGNKNNLDSIIERALAGQKSSTAW